MKDEELRNKLNELSELKDLKYFINNDFNSYKIIIKKDICCFYDIITEKRKVKVSRELLNDFVDYQEKKLNKEIEVLKKQNA